MEKFVEKDLFEPVKNYFVNLNYEVDGEVLNCDLVAVRNDEIVIVELKKTFNLKVVQQAIDRQEITDKVYIAIPMYKIFRDAEKQIALCKRLGIGLIFVDLTWSNKHFIALEPRMKINIVKYRKQWLLDEFNGRKVKNTTGGAVGIEHYTTYFQKNVELACILEKEGQCSLTTLRSKYNFKKTNIVYQDFYRWFINVEKGVYALNENGFEEIHSEKNKEIYSYYKQMVELKKE